MKAARPQRPETRKNAADQDVTHPQPGVGQLTSRPRIGGIEERGDTSAGSSGHVDTGGADTGSTPMFNQSKTDTPVMGVSRRVIRKLRPGA